MSATPFLTAITHLDQKMAAIDEYLEPAIGQSLYHNHWFTRAHVDLQWQALRMHYLSPKAVVGWLADYDVPHDVTSQRVGVICAGNIPMVGLHDILCVLASGHHAVVKCSSKDAYLLPALFKYWATLDKTIASRVTFVDRLEEVDAVIATGSNNTHRYFESYFGHLPHLLRKSRTSVAVLTSDFTDYDGLVDDVFLHFGLGCRNVSQLFLPRGMTLDPFFKASLKYQHYLQHSKYKNNFIYHTSIFQMNKVDYLTNDFVIMMDADQLFSPLSVVYYQYYDAIDEVSKFLDRHRDDVQAVYTEVPIEGLQTSLIGTGQRPRLEDYMDGVDTMKWLLSL